MNVMLVFLWEGKMKKKIRLLVLLAAGCAGIVFGESFYQTYTSIGTLSITNMGGTPWFVSSMVVKDIPVTATNILVKHNTTLLYNISLTSNTTAMLVKADFAGVWFSRGDIFTVTVDTNAVVKVDTEETR